MGAISSGGERGGLWASLARGPVYDAVQVVAGAAESRRRVVAELQLRPGDWLLDLGCGTGEIVAHLPEGVRYVGLDISLSCLFYGHRRWAERASFLAATAQAIPFATAGCFDHVVVAGVLHHLDDEAARGLLSFAWQALRPGGRVVCGDPVAYRGQRPLRRLMVRLDRGRHVRTPEGYSALLSAVFGTARGRVDDDAFRIPFSWYIQDARKD